MEGQSSRNDSDQGSIDSQKGPNNFEEEVAVSSIASSSRFASPTPESQTKWADEVSALVAMEEFVIQGVSSILRDGSIESLEQVPRRLIRYMEVLAQQGRSGSLWSQIKREIESSLIEKRHAIVNLGEHESFLTDTVKILTRTEVVLSILSKIYFLVSGSTPRDTRFLNMGVIPDIVLSDEVVLDRLGAIYMETIDLVTENTDLETPVDRVVMLSGYLSGDILDGFFQLIRKGLISNAKELLHKQHSIFSGERKDRSLLRHCQLLTSWIHTTEYAWNRIGLGRIPGNQKVLEGIFGSAITEENNDLVNHLPTVLIRNNAKALKAYQSLISKIKGRISSSDQFVSRALGQACTQVVNEGLRPIERAAVFQRLHALLLRCPAPDTDSYDISETWTAALRESGVDPAKIGRDLARYVLFEVVSPQDSISSPKRNKRVLNAGDLISVLNEDSRNKFVSEVLNNFKAALLPRPDGETIKIDQQSQQLIVATLNKIDRKYGYTAMIILSDLLTSASLDQYLIIGNRSAWHLDYQQSSVPGTKAQLKYEELYTDRKATISQALSSTEIALGENSFVVSNIQLAILKHLEGSTSTYKDLVQQLPFERSEIRNALVDLLSSKFDFIFWYSDQPGKTFKGDDIFALNPNPTPKTKFLYRLRIADNDSLEED